MRRRTTGGAVTKVFFDIIADRPTRGATAGDHFAEPGSAAMRRFGGLVVLTTYQLVGMQCRSLARFNQPHNTKETP
jgi:hypothetical protein